MKGKEKCRALKEIRRQIAEENDIPFAVSQCTHQGDCKGTCPKCESELRYLERELAVRQGLGKAVAVVGISTTLGTTLTACQAPQLIQQHILPGSPAQETIEELAGDISVPDEPSPVPYTEPDIAGGLQEWVEPDTDFTTGEIYIPEESIEELEGDIALPIEDDISDLEISGLLAPAETEAANP